LLIIYFLASLIDILTNKMNTFAIIPARGGSKSIPLKNIKQLHGKPLIEYTIELALESNLIDKVSVTTDSEEISNVVKKYKDVLLINRPDEIAQDTSMTDESLFHACEFVKNQLSYNPEIIVCLEPTSPLRKLETVDKSINIMKNNIEIDTVISVVENKSCYGNIKKNKFIYHEKNLRRRRQDREPLYIECGNVYTSTYEKLKTNNSLIGKNVYPIIVNYKESIDINDPIDFKIAEALLLS